MGCAPPAGGNNSNTEDEEQALCLVVWGDNLSGASRVEIDCNKCPAFLPVITGSDCL